MVELKRFDATDYLRSDEEIEAFLDDALQTDEPVEIADALVLIARAKGMTAVAEAAGMPTASLLRTPDAQTPPTWATLLKVMKALGLRLTPVTVKSAA